MVSIYGSFLMLAVVGLSHHTAPLEVRERLAVSSDQLPELLARLAARPAVGEVLCLSTCNRVEVIATPAMRGQGDTQRLAEELAQALEEIALLPAGRSLRPHLYERTDREGLLHLFRVAASLDSLVVGEPQILGQVKDAGEAARAAGTLGPTLSRVLDRALQVAKRVRHETSVGEGLVSVAGVAVDLARQIFGDLRGRRVLLIGAGQMAEAAAQNLARSHVRLDILNRSPERAADLARRMNGRARPWDELAAALVDADVVLCSAGGQDFIVTRDAVAQASRARRGRPLFFLDIAVPRNVEPTVNTLENTFLYDVDDLEGIVAASFDGRRSEAVRAERLVEEAVGALSGWVETRGMVPTVVALRAKVQSTFTAELERTLAGKLKHLSEPDRAALGAMVDAAVNKLLHAPITRLKQGARDPAGEQIARTVRDLFELPDVGVVTDGVTDAIVEPSAEPVRVVPAKSQGGGAR